MTHDHLDQLVAQSEQPIEGDAEEVFILPSSFAQERLWFIQQLDPSSAAYNVPAALRICGALDCKALEDSLHAVVQRHEVLRTSFETADGRPVQVIYPEGRIGLRRVDVQQIAPAEREAEVHRLAHTEAMQPFDLRQRPLLRAMLIQLADQEYVLLFTMHHIITDMWSMELLIHEVVSFYTGYAAGQAVALPDLPMQYGDFAIWQREWCQGAMLEQQLAYWRKQLQQIPTLLPLPSDRPRPAVQRYHGAEQRFTIPAPIAHALKRLSAEHGVTLFVTLLAAFKVLLYRYSGQSDIVVGTPIANRNRREIEGLIGFFVNTLVLRSNLAAAPSFSTFLAQVAELAFDAYAHQDIPFDVLVEQLQPTRDLSRTPLFQVMFAFHNREFSGMEIAGLQVSPLLLPSQTAMFDLTLELVNGEQELNALIEYSSDLFDAATIVRMSRHFQQLLAAIVADPTAPITRLALLPADELAQLMDWRQSATVAFPASPIHTLFAAQVARSPDAIALVADDEQLTFRVLNERAEQLAAYLRSLGVGPEQRVAVFLERSVLMLVGLLGVLKAGGAYVPIDPGYPPQRISHMIEDVQATLVLTTTQLQPRLPNSTGLVIALDSTWPVPTGSPQAELGNTISADHLMYVIYTSGSTDRPRGVLLTHRSVSSHFHWMQQQFPLTNRDCVLQQTSFSFDVAVWELFAPLLQGVRLVLARPGGEKDPSYLAQTLATQGVTVIQLVPTLLRMLVQTSLLKDCPALRRVFCGGEALPTDLPSQFFAQSRAELINMYGPTETCIDATFWPCTPSESATRLPIGRPIGNAQIYILDQQLQPVPIGVPGELYIGGAGVARGYLNRPDLTAERFVPNPFEAADDTGVAASPRLYRSGDLVRYRANGQIEFLGRVDQQVKIRGFRIEPGEIAPVLLQHPAVREAVVIARADAPGNPRLLAYVCLHDWQSASAEDAQQQLQLEWRALLKARLPDYMLPAACIILEALPLLPNGKLDQRALPAPPELPATASQYVAPRNAIELQLVRIWEQLLGIAPIGVQHNFFELGGHSFLAAQLMARIQQHFGRQLALSVLFQGATIEQLATLLRQQEPDAPVSCLIQLQPGQAGIRPLFLVHPIGGNVFCYLELLRQLDPTQPVYALQARGSDGRLPPHTTIAAMAQEYLDLIRSIQPTGPYRLAGWSFGGVVAFEMARQLHAAAEPVELLALIDSFLPDTETAKASDEMTLMGEFAADLGLPLAELEAIAPHAQGWHNDERLTWIMQQAQQRNLFPADIELDQMRHLWLVYQQNLAAWQSYRAQPYPGPALLFSAAHPSATVPAHRGWDALIGAGLTIHTLPGDHYSLLRAPDVALLGEELQRWLGETALR